MTVNDYEGQMLQERTGKKLEELAKSVKALVVTLGARGSLIMTNGRSIEIPSVEPERVADPTGCGDAYRAGLLYGIAAGLDWPVTGRLASLLGSIKIEQPRRPEPSLHARRGRKPLPKGLWFSAVVSQGVSRESRCGIRDAGYPVSRNPYHEHVRARHTLTRRLNRRTPRLSVPRNPAETAGRPRDAAR